MLYAYLRNMSKTHTNAQGVKEPNGIRDKDCANLFLSPLYIIGMLVGKLSDGTWGFEESDFKVTAL